MPVLDQGLEVLGDIDAEIAWATGGHGAEAIAGGDVMVPLGVEHDGDGSGVGLGGGEHLGDPVGGRFGEDLGALGAQVFHQGLIECLPESGGGFRHGLDAQGDFATLAVSDLREVILDELGVGEFLLSVFGDKGGGGLVEGRLTSIVDGQDLADAG